jgi:predicted PurR-regulated permease PerM
MKRTDTNERRDEDMTKYIDKTGWLGSAMSICNFTITVILLFGWFFAWTYDREKIDSLEEELTSYHNEEMSSLQSIDLKLDSIQASQDELSDALASVASSQQDEISRLKDISLSVSSIGTQLSSATNDITNLINGLGSGVESFKDGMAPQSPTAYGTMLSITDGKNITFDFQ